MSHCVVYLLYGEKKGVVDGTRWCSPCLAPRAQTFYQDPWEPWENPQPGREVGVNQDFLSVVPQSSLMSVCPGRGGWD